MWANNAHLSGTSESDNVIAANKLDAVVSSSMGNNIVNRQRSPDALERHLGNSLDQNSALDGKDLLRSPVRSPQRPTGGAPYPTFPGGLAHANRRIAHGFAAGVSPL
jgi:hypothetical protein